MKAFNLLLCTSALLISTGCATRSDLSDVRQDLDEMKTRTMKVEKDLGGVRNETREGMETNLKGFQKEIESLRKTAADLQATMDNNRIDVQVLGGKVDDLMQQGKKPAEELALLREDTTQKQSAVEARLDKLEKGMDEVQKLVAELKSREAEKTPDAIYQRGIDSYRANDFPKAREQFNHFIELFPKHDLTANAHYWLGETYYSEKVYDQAILEFEKVIKNFPSKGKVSAALLKQGMAFKELGDTKSARFVYKKLIENYPLADEVKPAKERLKELK
jgi:tol-pal system protein YbgF